MNSAQDIERHLEREPALDQARRASVMAHSVVIKLKEMGLPEELDGELSQLCTDLGDLWSAQSSLARQLEGLLKGADDWEVVGDGLVDINSTIEHMAWHMKGIAEPMAKIAEYAYERGNGE